MKVSVVIVNYRSYDDLAVCLGSLCSSRRDDVEVIVVDHAAEEAKVQRVGAAFPWVRILATAENPGFAAGVNRAAMAATGEYLLLLNPDSIVHEDVCHELARWLDSHPDVGIAGALVRDSDGSIQASARRFPDVTTAFGGRSSWLTRIFPGNPLTARNLLAQARPSAPTVVDWVSGACMMVRRRAFESVGGMDEDFFLYWEDADLCRRLQQAGWRTVYHPGVTVTHHCGRASRHASRRSLIAFHDSAYRYYRKHGGILAAVLAPAVYLGLRARLAAKLALRHVGRP